MSKLSKAQITLELEFLEGEELEGFSVYDALHAWARQVSNGLERDQTIFLGDYQLVQTTPFVELPKLKFTIPGRDEPHVTTKEDEQQYRCSDPRKVTQNGFARYVLQGFGITYDFATDDD